MQTSIGKKPTEILKMITENNTQGKKGRTVEQKSDGTNIKMTRLNPIRSIIISYINETLQPKAGVVRLD